MVTREEGVGQRTAALMGAEDASARRCVLLALALTALVAVPMLAASPSTMFDDDWAWIWVHYWQGTAALQNYMWAVAHPGFGPLYDLYFFLGGNEPGRAARTIGLLFHLGNGWLLWRIFRDGRAPLAFSATLAVLYLSAPFLGALRGSAAHDVYDEFIFCYLLSILWCTQYGILFIGALLAIFGGLLLETLAALEVVRWWYLYQHGYRRGGFVLRASPFLILIVAFAISRTTWMAPTGDFAGHNEIRVLSPAYLVHQAYLHIQYYFHALYPTRYAVSLLHYDNPALGFGIAFFSISIAVARFRADAESDGGDLAKLGILGCAMFIAGMLPYLAASNVANWTSFYSRLAVTSQFGVFILTALLCEIFRTRWLRAAVVGIISFVFFAMQLQMGKWVLYDGLAIRDVQRQLAEEFRTHGKELLFVRFHPSSDKVFYIQRCLANYDINVWLNIHDLDHGSLAYDADCDAAESTAQGMCGPTGFDQVPCPPVWYADFRFDPGEDQFTHFRLVDLIEGQVTGKPLNVGRLSVDRASGPQAAGATHP